MKPTTVKMTATLKEQARRLAKSKDKPLSQWIRQLVEREVKKTNGKKRVA